MPRSRCSPSYFCPGRAVVRTSAEAQQAIRAGGHPGTHRENRGIGEQY
jgi:hypothetical protein